MTKQLLIVHPAAGKLDAKTLRTLARHGFIVVVGDPSHFKAVDFLTLGGTNAILRAALHTIHAPNVTSYRHEIRSQFALKLCDLLLAADTVVDAGVVK